MSGINTDFGSEEQPKHSGPAMIRAFAEGLERYGVMRFANAADRARRVPNPEPGMISYLKNVQDWEWFPNTKVGWVSMTPAGKAAAVTRSSDQTVGAGATVAVSFDTTVFDTTGQMVSGSLPTRITIPVAGMWVICGVVKWNNNTASGYRQVWLRRSGGGTGAVNLALANQGGTTGSQIEICVGTVALLQPGHYIELMANNTGGTSTSVLTVTTPPRLCVAQIGAA